jgi:hypothetical protein
MCVEGNENMEQTGVVMGSWLRGVLCSVEHAVERFFVLVMVLLVHVRGREECRVVDGRVAWFSCENVDVCVRCLCM